MNASFFIQNCVICNRVMASQTIRAGDSDDEANGCCGVFCGFLPKWFTSTQDSADFPTLLVGSVPIRSWTHFYRLNMTDLTNVAEAHPNFAVAAQSVYQRNFSHLEVTVSQSGHTLRIKRQGELEVALESFIKLFGKLVLRIKLDYCNATPDISDAHHWREAERLIFAHCESLTGLQLVNCREDAFEEIRNTFQKVTQLRITGRQPNILREPNARNKWFPNAPYITRIGENATNQNADGGEVEGEVEVEGVADALSITDLNEYCLESIFQFLNATDLTNIAETCTYFGLTAQLIYKRQYSRRKLAISESGHELTIEGGGRLKVTLASFMKHFGKLVQNVKLNYYSSADNVFPWHWRQAERILIAHCADTLKSIRLDCDFKKMKVMEQLRKPFTSVEELSISYLQYSRFFSNNFGLNMVFPNVRRLSLDGSGFQYLADLIGPLRHLTEFSVNNAYRPNDDEFRALREFLLIHPFVKRLAMNGYFFECYYNFGLFLSQTLLHLEHLDITVQRNASSPEKIHFSSVTSFAFRQTFYGDYENYSIPFTFDNLKSLAMDVIWKDIRDARWINFISQQRELVELEIQFRCKTRNITFSAEELYRIISALPRLQIFKFSCDRYSFSFTGRQIFLRKCKALKQLKTVDVNFNERDWDSLILSSNDGSEDDSDYEYDDD